jgi:hypothetical protein
MKKILLTITLSVFTAIVFSQKIPRHSDSSTTVVHPPTPDEVLSGRKEITIEDIMNRNERHDIYLDNIDGTLKRDPKLYLPMYKTIYKFNYNKLIGASALGFVAGCAKGTRDVLTYHTENFFKVHPSTNRQFWDSRISWKNKYKDFDNGDYSTAYFGAKDLLVWTTDANHLLDGMQTLSLVGGTMVICLGDKRPWWEYAINFAALFVSRSAGFELFYNYIYK